MEINLVFLQWPAMATALIGTGLITSNRRWKRNVGFGLALLSNILWGWWGVYEAAWALIAMQVGIAALNLRGFLKTKDKK